MHRRTFLKDAALTVICSGGTYWYAPASGVSSANEDSPYAAWQDWQNADNKSPLALVRAAILAASPHNTQPWRFKVASSFVELHIDRQRNVGPLDPFLREEFIGMGCALENMLLAAPANAYTATPTLLPGPLSPISAGRKTELVARVDLAPGPVTKTELYQSIPFRHTNRSVYDHQKPLPPDFIDALRNLTSSNEDVRLFLFTDESKRKQIVQISEAANTEVYSDPKIEAASQHWIRLTSDDISKFRDGLTIDTFGLSPLTTVFAKALPKAILAKLVARGQMNGYSDRMMTAPLIGFIAVRDRYDRANCLRAGRLWQRAHLFATSRGIAARPSNEASERIDYERMLGRPANTLSQLAHITGDPAWQPTFVFLMGHPTLAAHASPRKSVQEVLNA